MSAIPGSSRNTTPPLQSNNGRRFVVCDRLYNTYVGTKNVIILFYTEQSAKNMKKLCTGSDIEFIEYISCEEYAIWDVKHEKLHRPRHLETCIVEDLDIFIDKVSRQGVKVFDVFYMPHEYTMVGHFISKNYSLRDRADALEDLIL